MKNKFFQVGLVSLSVIFSLAAATFAQTSPSKEFAGIKISNFGKMDDNFYRGAKPKASDYAALKALGIKTIVDLQAEPEDFARSAAEAAGLVYINVPIVDKAYPTQENIDQFLKVIHDPATGVFYAHCAGGRHRTGDMGALYRFEKYGWDYDQVYKEMKNYDFYSSWGHGKQKEFVKDFATKYAQAKLNAPAVTAPAPVTDVQIVKAAAVAEKGL